MAAYDKGAVDPLLGLAQSGPDALPTFFNINSHVLIQFGPKSFDIAFDKGAVDALMGEDTDAASSAGSMLLSEVRRVLTHGGQYICVTLAQPHVLRKRFLEHPARSI